jgi:hypothetical protein
VTREATRNAVYTTTLIIKTIGGNMENQPISIEAKCFNCPWELTLLTALSTVLDDTEFVHGNAQMHEMELDHHVSIQTVKE